MIWGDTPCGFSYRPSEGASGGLITLWDTSRVDVCSTMSFGGVLIIRGKIIDSGEEFAICNVYAPCDSVAKRELWERLIFVITNNGDICLCLCGHFNVVRHEEERKGRGTIFRQADADMFNNFIVDGALIDIPICGRLLLGTVVTVFL